MKNLISIIIPVYNKSEELRASLVSLLQQTYQNYEVIIVNDGSTDNSALVIEEMKQKFWDKSIRCKIIQQSNQGSNYARNRGLEEVTQGGQGYLLFWDADTVASPVMLAKMVKTLQDNPEVSYVYSSFILGKKKFKLWSFDAEKLKQMPYIDTTSLIRREHFPKNGWDVRIKKLQDWDLWLTMLKQNHQGIFIDEFLFTKLAGSNTMSAWFPKILYKIPLFKKKEVQSFKKAEEIIKKKHNL